MFFTFFTLYKWYKIAQSVWILSTQSKVMEFGNATNKGALSGLRQILAFESHLKMMKNAFYFTLKLVFLSRYLNFCPDFLVMWKKGLIRKLRLISKFMTSLVSNCNILISTNILTHISRSTGNLSMKFGQLIEYNMRTFSWKIISKMWGRTIPRPFSKNIKLSIYLDQFFYFFNSVGFYRMPS